MQRRNQELRRKNQGFALGYGPAGRVPAHVQAKVSSLDKSPLSRPVISPGRYRQRSALRRRPRSADSPNRRTCVAEKRPGRPSTASGHYLAADPPQPQEQQGGLSSSPLLVDKPMARSAKVSHAVMLAGGRVRPATAPQQRRRTRRYSASRTRLGGDEGREEAEAEAEEAQLIEQLARLSGAQQRSEFPTVASLKTAVALKALQAQLRECRAKNGQRKNRTPGDGGGGDKGKRAVSAPISRSHHHRQRAIHSADGGPTAPQVCRSKGRQRRGNKQRQLKPWDNRSPFVADSVPPGTNNGGATGNPTNRAAPVLRNLTHRDPVFGCLKVSPSLPSPSSPTWSTHFLARPESPPTQTGGPNSDHNGGARVVACSPSTDSPDGADVAAGIAAPVPPETMQLQASFRRLTVGALIELNHLRNPPKPVLAVLAGLGCLLGWKQRGSPSKKSRHKGLHQPPRSLFSNAYVLRDVLASVCPTKMPERRLSALTRILEGPEAAPAKVRSASASASLLLEWLLSVVACARSAGACGARERSSSVF